MSIDYNFYSQKMVTQKEIFGILSRYDKYIQTENFITDQSSLIQIFCSNPDQTYYSELALEIISQEYGFTPNTTLSIRQSKSNLDAAFLNTLQVIIICIKEFLADSVLVFENEKTMIQYIDKNLVLNQNFKMWSSEALARISLPYKFADLKNTFL